MNLIGDTLGNFVNRLEEWDAAAGKLASQRKWAVVAWPAKTLTSTSLTAGILGLLLGGAGGGLGLGGWALIKTFSIGLPFFGAIVAGPFSLAVGAALGVVAGAAAGFLAVMAATTILAVPGATVLGLGVSAHALLTEKKPNGQPAPAAVPAPAAANTPPAIAAPDKEINRADRAFEDIKAMPKAERNRLLKRLNAEFGTTQKAIAAPEQTVFTTPVLDLPDQTTPALLTRTL